VECQNLIDFPRKFRSGGLLPQKRMCFLSWKTLNHLYFSEKNLINSNMKNIVFLERIFIVNSLKQKSSHNIWVDFVLLEVVLWKKFDWRSWFLNEKEEIWRKLERNRFEKPFVYSNFARKNQKSFFLRCLVCSFGCFCDVQCVRSVVFFGFVEFFIRVCFFNLHHKNAFFYENLQNHSEILFCVITSN